jgi:hypothetical protein
MIVRNTIGQIQVKAFPILRSHVAMIGMHFPHWGGAPKSSVKGAA